MMAFPCGTAHILSPPPYVSRPGAHPPARLLRPRAVRGGEEKEKGPYRAEILVHIDRDESLVTILLPPRSSFLPPPAPACEAVWPIRLYQPFDAAASSPGQPPERICPPVAHAGRGDGIVIAEKVSRRIARGIEAGDGLAFRIQDLEVRY